MSLLIVLDIEELIIHLKRTILIPFIIKKCANIIVIQITSTRSISNYKTFNFLAPNLTTHLIQKSYTNIVKFKSFFKNFY